MSVITVDGCLVIQANYDVAKHCLNLYFHLFILVFADKNTHKQGKTLNSVVNVCYFSNFLRKIE